MYTTKNGTDDNERYTMELQSDRKLSEKSYVFGVYRYVGDNTRVPQRGTEKTDITTTMNLVYNF